MPNGTQLPQLSRLTEIAEQPEEMFEQAAAQILGQRPPEGPAGAVIEAQRQLETQGQLPLPGSVAPENIPQFPQLPAGLGGPTGGTGGSAKGSDAPPSPRRTGVRENPDGSLPL